MADNSLDKAYQNKYIPVVAKTSKKIEVVFFANDRGKEPVKDWLLNVIRQEDRKIIGADIKTVEFGWPVGMPVCKPIGNGLYEVRSTLPNRTEARVIFTIHGCYMILLHGFIKKTAKMQRADMRKAMDRLKKFNNSLGPQKGRDREEQNAKTKREVQGGKTSKN